MKRRNGSTIYMAVTPDTYELPLDFADTLNELCKRTGKSRTLISSSICHRRSGKEAGMKFIRVEL